MFQLNFLPAGPNQSSLFSKVKRRYASQSEVVVNEAYYPSEVHNI